MNGSAACPDQAFAEQPHEGPEFSEQQCHVVPDRGRKLVMVDGLVHVVRHDIEHDWCVCLPLEEIEQRTDLGRAGPNKLVTDEEHHVSLLQLGQFQGVTELVQVIVVSVPILLDEDALVLGAEVDDRALSSRAVVALRKKRCDFGSLEFADDGAPGVIPADLPKRMG